MDNAPKIAVLVVLALVVGGIFVATSTDFGKNASTKMTDQTNTLFNKAESAVNGTK